MSKHTIGPWHTVTEFKDMACIVCANPSGQIASCEEHPRMSRDEAEANARLISAAPDLLAALKELVGQHDFSYLDKGIGTGTPDGRRWLDARAAIHKVEGGQP